MWSRKTSEAPAGQGIVAFRIRSFQSLENANEHVSHSSNETPTYSKLPEPDVTFGHGRRAESHFASPATRVSRDGHAGTRGDGRPPIGDADVRSLASSSSGFRGEQEQSTRPATSLALNSQTELDPFYASNNTKRLVRKQRSKDRVNRQVPEFVNARSRLRSIAESKASTPQDSSDKSYTIDDLGNMLDTAIQDHVGSIVTKTQDPSINQPGTNTTVTRRSNSADTSRKSLDLVPGAFPQQKKLSASEVAEPAASNGDDMTAIQPVPTTEFLLQPSPKRPTQSISRLESRAVDTKEHSFLIPKSSRGERAESPVKEKAAAYERLEQESPAKCSRPAAHLHVEDGWFAFPAHLLATEDSKQTCNLKFTHKASVDSNSQALSDSTTQAKRDRPTSSEHLEMQNQKFVPQPPSRRTSHTGSVRRTSSKSHRHDRGRKSSLNWPFKWKPFAKGQSATAHEFGTEDNATDERINNDPPSRTGTVRSKVQTILDANRKLEEAQQVGRQSSSNAVPASKSRNTSQVKDFTTNGSSQAPSKFDQRGDLPSQVAVEEHSIAPFGVADGNNPTNPDYQAKAEISISSVRTPQTPIHHLWREKEALARSPVVLNMTTAQSSTARSISPVKVSVRSQPCTPPRGRCALTKSSPSSSVTHSVEHRYVLTSHSRSRSRADSSRIRLELQLQESPEREARERGDKVLVLKANIATTDSSTDGEEEKN